MLQLGRASLILLPSPILLAPGLAACSHLAWQSALALAFLEPERIEVAVPDVAGLRARILALVRPGYAVLPEAAALQSKWQVPLGDGEARVPMLWHPTNLANVYEFDMRDA